MLSNKSNEKGIENSSVEQYVEVVETAPVTPAEPEMLVSEPEESPAEPEMPVSEPEESPVEQVDFIEEVAPVVLD